MMRGGRGVRGGLAPPDRNTVQLVVNARIIPGLPGILGWRRSSQLQNYVVISIRWPKFRPGEMCLATIFNETTVKAEAEGKGVARDSAKAFALIRALAEQGELEAVAELGLYYENGSGVARDNALAATWLRLRSAA